MYVISCAVKYCNSKLTSLFPTRLTATQPALKGRQKNSFAFSKLLIHCKETVQFMKFMDLLLVPECCPHHWVNTIQNGVLPSRKCTVWTVFVLFCFQVSSVPECCLWGITMLHAVDNKPRKIMTVKQMNLSLLLVWFFWNETSIVITTTKINYVFQFKTMYYVCINKSGFWFDISLILICLVSFSKWGHCHWSPSVYRLDVIVLFLVSTSGNTLAWKTCQIYFCLFYRKLPSKSFGTLVVH